MNEGRIADTTWWVPCVSAMGFTLGARPSDWKDFEAKHILIEESSGGPKKDYSSVGGSYTVFLEDDLVSGIHFEATFLISGFNIIGSASADAIDRLSKNYGAACDDMKVEDVWTEINGNTFQRFIDFDELCLFLTENGEGTIIGADIYR